MAIGSEMCKDPGGTAGTAVEQTMAKVDLQRDPDPKNLQAGVQRAEMLREGWTKQGLVVAFVGLFLSTLSINFADYSTQVYAPYITSAFKQHSAMSAGVVMNITRISAYPIIAKLGDIRIFVFGRAEMFILSIVTSVLGYVIYAACQDIAQYMTAGIFEAIGSTAYALTQQVFVVDVTNLIYRGVWSTLPDSLTTIPTLYLGTIVAERILDHSTWRWGWGMWAIVLPVSAVPLIGSMLVHQHRVTSQVMVPQVKDAKLESPWWQRVYDLLWVQLDLPGGFLLVLGLSLFLMDSLVQAMRHESSK
ncbi:uncharacterized protein CDV56_104191 [Aspergillus thermomutatus]|uniref:Major facilitator superfamily (MFS) profile domain-containing protein n=1 Tax=Aspergillus thermomutatus TaxID=41047 RepID=A0A397HEA5_ASPTH|nr:uncharacterized protein CDV56_104191 [Aspergillus thermomutatus]RHZ61435.1 hypothetical protein CDV56_104191 [Aspergillus thermomutatus]